MESDREQLKERFYTAEERELADTIAVEWVAANEISRIRREAFLEIAHAVAEQISAEFAETLQLPAGYTVAFDETQL